MSTFGAQVDSIKGSAGLIIANLGFSAVPSLTKTEAREGKSMNPQTLNPKPYS